MTQQYADVLVWYWSSDINPIDILEKSKAVSMDEISRDLEAEVNSAAAQMFRDRLNAAEEGESDDEETNDGSKAELLQALHEESVVGTQICIDLETRSVTVPPPKAPATADENLEDKVTSPSLAEREAHSASATSKRPKSFDTTIRKCFVCQSTYGAQVYSPTILRLCATGKKSASRRGSSSENEVSRRLSRLSSANSRSRERNSQQFEATALKTNVVFGESTIPNISRAMCTEA